MKSLFDPAAASEIVSRIHSLRPETKALWGKMNSAQMFAHNVKTLEYACGVWGMKQVFIGKLIGGFMKKSFYNDKPYGQGEPTAPQFVMINQQCDFEKEKNALLELVQRFHSGGPANATKHPHGFFGHFGPEQWGMGVYKHLDHHLKQFGV